MVRILAVLLTCLASHSVADQRTFDTFSGPQKINATPKRVVALDVAAIDSLTAMGIDLVGVPQKLFVEYLDDVAAQAQPAGTVFEPDYEAIFAMRPDLIISGGRSSAETDALAQIAPTIDMTIWGETIEQAKERIKAYGVIFDKEDVAAQLIADLDAKIARTRTALAGQGKALIILTNGPKISAYGRSGRFGWLHSALDLPEAVPKVEQSTHGEVISFEFIRKTDPDVIFVVDRLAAVGRAGDHARTTLDTALIHGTKAWKSGKVIFLDAADIYIAGGGIQALNRTLDQITDGLGKAH